MHVFILPIACAAMALSPVFSHAGDTSTYKTSTLDAGNLPVNIVSSAPMTLAQALQLAENANPTLKQAKAQRASAEGDVADARALLWNNPKLAADRVRREVPQTGLPVENRREWSAGIEQTFEIAGQQGYRRKAARQQLDALDAAIEDTRREVMAEVERRFVMVLSLQERIATERLSLKIVEDTAAFVTKRVVAGEDSRLDGNLASVEAVRARNLIGALDEQLMQARAELAAALQLPGDVFPVVEGSLTTAAPTYTLEALLATAANRPLLRSLDLREQAAKNRLALERASRYPDVTVGLTTGREGAIAARERLTSFSVSIPLPLFRQNSGAIGRASTELNQAQIERQTANRNGGASVAALWQKLHSLVQRVDALRLTALPALDDNQRLSMKTLQAGEIGLSQLLLVNRQVLDGRRDLIDAETELRLTRIALHLAAGWTEVGSAQ